MTCAVACTPASVRPAHTTRTGRSATLVSACSTLPCTVRTPPSCDCQPAKSLPSYSMPRAIRMVWSRSRKRSASLLQMQWRARQQARTKIRIRVSLLTPAIDLDEVRATVRQAIRSNELCDCCERATTRQLTPSRRRVRMRHQRLALALEQPLAEAIGVAVLAEFATGIEQHDDHRPFADHGLHHQAVTGFADVASLAEVDVPGRGTHQAVGVDEFDVAAAAPAVGDIKLTGGG